MELPHFLHWLHELRRRHVRRVFRALVAYGIVAFALIEIAHPVTLALHLPEWTLTFVVVVLALGFPVVTVLAWLFGGPEGAGDDVTAAAPRRRLDGRMALLLVGAGLLVAAPGVAYYFLRGRGEAETGAAVPSVAVLPFADLSPSRDQEYFADGIADEILDALGHVDGLHVPGRASSFFFKGKSVKLGDIGRELGVRAVLEGSVRKEGNRVRISAAVVDVASGRRVWSETYDRELTGVFAVQEEIARSVADALRVKLLPGREPVVRQHARTTRPDAYNAYLLGRHYFDRGNTDGFRRSVDALEKALAADPDYAPAWAWLATALLNFTVASEGGAPRGDASEGPLARAVAAADRAVALGPDVPEAHSARGWMRTSITWDWAGAQSDLQRAVDLDPRDANTLVRQAFLAGILGRFPEAIATTRRAAEIDPLYVWPWFFLAYFYDGSGRADLAEEAATHALDLAPQNALALRELGVARLLRGNASGALSVFQRHPWEVTRLFGAALAQHDLGNEPEARKALDELRTRFGDRAAWEIAQVHAWRGDRDAAFEWLDRSYARHNVGLRVIKLSPLLKDVRRDGRYAALLARMNLPAD